MNCPRQTITFTNLYYVLFLVTVDLSAKLQNTVTANADICVDVLSETYKPGADVIIGFIGTKHLSSSGSTLCDLNETRNDQIFEAAKILVDHPPSSVLLPNVTLGLELYDDCGASSLVTKAALRFASSSHVQCGNLPLRPGVIGPTVDSVVPAAAAVLGAVSIPIVTPTAAVRTRTRTPPDTDGTYPGNVLRTLPSISKQAQVFVELFEYFGWDYISIIATRGRYGEGGANETRRLAEDKGICTSDTILLDATETDDFVYDDIVTTLLSNFEAKAVVLWCSSNNNMGLLESIERTQGDAFDLVLITTDIAVSNVTLLDSYPNAVRGLIGLRPFDSSNVGIVNYLAQYSNLTFDNLLTVPVVNALQAIMFALSNIHKEKCNGIPGLCPDMAGLSAEEMLEELKEISFTGLDGEGVDFDNQGNPTNFTLEILQYQNDTNDAPGAVYSLKQVGVWTPNNGLFLKGSFQHYSQNGLVFSSPTSTCGNLCASCTSSNHSAATPSSNPAQNHGNPYKNRGDHYMRIPGDLDIPSILSLSEPGYFGHYDGLLCGYVREKEVLTAEALLYAVGKVNNDPDVFPGIKLGITVMDSCKQSVIATRQLTGVLGQTTNLESTGPIVGILGPDTDDVAKKVVDEITAPAGLLTISHGNTPSVTESSNFFQTTPSLNDQVQVIAVLLSELDWYYTGIIYSNTTYGKAGYKSFRDAAKQLGICLGPARIIPTNPMQPDFDVILSDMYNSKDLNVIVTFVEEFDARRLLVTEHLYAFDRFAWVGTETWTADPELFEGFEKQARGSLVVLPSRGDLTDFQQYLSTVPVQEATDRNPWLMPALRRIFPCDNMTTEELSRSDDQFFDCVDLGTSGLSTLITLGEYNGDIIHIINAFYALAYAADGLRQRKCVNESQMICAEFFEALRSNEFYSEVANVTFETNEQQFAFVDKTGPPDFTIQNFQQIGEDLQLQQVGRWSKGNLALDSSLIFFDNAAVEEPQRDPLKCGLCFNDTEYDPPQILEWELEGIWVTIILAVSAVCLFLIACAACAFVFNHNNHVVTSASLSLSLWLLLGLAMMYCMNLAYMVHANTTICAIRRVGTALGYAITYSALSVKSIRVNRLVRGKPGDSMSFTGSWSQTLLFCVFVSAQYFIAAAWLLLQRPNANAIPGAIIRCDEQENLWSCDYTHLELAVSLAYVYALVLFTFFSSIGAAKYPFYLNEGKYLFVSSVSSMGILVTWTCLYVLADQSIAIPALCIGVTADATIVLAAMFLPKCGSIGKPLKIGESLDHKPIGDGRKLGVVNDKEETTNF